MCDGRLSFATTTSRDVNAVRPRMPPTDVPSAPRRDVEAASGCAAVVDGRCAQAARTNAGATTAISVPPNVAAIAPDTPVPSTTNGTRRMIRAAGPANWVSEKSRKRSRPCANPRTMGVTIVGAIVAPMRMTAVRAAHVEPTLDGAGADCDQDEQRGAATQRPDEAAAIGWPILCRSAWAAHCAVRCAIANCTPPSGKASSPTIARSVTRSEYLLGPVADRAAMRWKTALPPFAATRPARTTHLPWCRACGGPAPPTRVSTSRRPFGWCRPPIQASVSWCRRSTGHRPSVLSAAVTAFVVLFWLSARRARLDARRSTRWSRCRARPDRGSAVFARGDARADRHGDRRRLQRGGRDRAADREPARARLSGATSCRSSSRSDASTDRTEEIALQYPGVR